MVRGSFEDFDQWEFVIGRRHVAPSWQNGCVERLIGSIRRECLDHVVVFNERHLRHLLLSYMKYCNKARTHLSLQKDARVFRAARCRTHGGPGGENGRLGGGGDLHFSMGVSQFAS